MASHGVLQDLASRESAEIQDPTYDIDHVVSKSMLIQLHSKVKPGKAQQPGQRSENQEKHDKFHEQPSENLLERKANGLGDHPVDLTTMKTDLQQAQHRSEYYKRLFFDAQQRADRYQQQLSDVVKQNLVFDDTRRRVEVLEVETSEQCAMITNLTQEVDNAERASEDLQEQHRTIIRQRDERIATLTGDICKLTDEIQRIEGEQEVLLDTYGTLVDSLEADSQAIVTAFNLRSLHLLNSDQLYSAISSEMVPLNLSLQSVVAMVDACSMGFQAVINRDQALASTLTALELQLAESESRLRTFQEVRAVIQLEGLAEDQVTTQLNQMAGHVKHLLETLRRLNSVAARLLGDSQIKSSFWQRTRNG